MELANFDLKSSLLSQEHLESYKKNNKFVRTYEQIMESEVNRANPILKGHTKEVIGAALNSDNSFIISAGKDNTLKIWSLIDRVEEQNYNVLTGTEDYLIEMALSSDDKFVVFIVSMKYVIVWSLETHQVTARVQGKDKVYIGFLSISSDNSMFCVVECSKIINVYDMAGNLLKSFQPEESTISKIAFAQKIIFIGYSNAKIHAWNIQTSAIEFTLEHTHTQPTAFLLFDNNRYLAAGYPNGDLVVWNILEKTNFKINFDHGWIINISHSGSYENGTLVCSTDQKKLVFVDLASKNMKHYFIRHTDVITSVAQTKDGKLVITASSDKLIKIWQQDEFRSRKVSNRFGTSIRASALDKENGLLAIAYNNLSVKVFNLNNDKELYSLAWKGKGVFAAIWSQNKKRLITSNQTPEILVFSYETKKVEYSIPLDISVYDLVVSPDDKYLCGCNGGTKIFIWSLHDKRIDQVIETETDHIVLLFRKDWTKMYSGGTGVINVWDWATKSIEHKLEGHTASVICLVLLSDQNTLISGGNDGKIIFWNLEENKLDVCIQEEISARSMDLFCEEKFLVVVHSSDKITVVNVIEKKIEYEFNGPGPQYCCKMLNETTLIMGDYQYIRFMNLPERKEEYSIKAHSNDINGILLDTEKDTLISFSYDYTIKSYKISTRSEQTSYQSYCGTIIALSLSKDYLALATAEGKVFIYNTNSKTEYKSIIAHNDAVQSIDYYKGNFATGSSDKKVGLFDVNSNEPYYFVGHTDKVRVVKFSNDGKLIFSGSDDKKIKAWNIEKKNQEYDFDKHENPVISLCVFEKTNLLASGSEDKSVKLWDLDIRSEEASFENHSGNVLSLTKSNDEKFIISGSADLSIAVMSVETKKLACVMASHSNYVLNVHVYNNTLYSTDGTEVKSWLIDEKKEIFSMKSKQDYPVYIVLSPDEKYLATSFSEGLIRIYDFESKKFLEAIQPFNSDIVPRIDFTPDSMNILIAIPDYDIVIWNFINKKSQEIPGSKPTARNIKFSSNHSFIATFSNENKVCVWDWKKKKLMYSFEGHTDLVQAMVFSNDNKYLFTGGDDNLIIKFDLESKEKFVYSDQNYSIKGLAFAHNKNILVAGGQDKKVIFYKTDKNEKISSVDVFANILTIAITNDEKYAISAGEDKVLNVWNIDTQSCAFKLEGHTGFIYSIAISKDNDHVYSGATDKTMWVWSLNEKRREKYLRSVFGIIYCIALNRQGTIAYVGSDENTVNVFDIANKSEITCLFGHTRIVCDIALSEDETILVSGSWDCTVRVYNIINERTFTELALLKDGHADYVRSVAITRDKKYVISGSDDTRIILWNLESKIKEFVLEGHRGFIYSVRLTPDEKYLISGSSDQTIKIWDLTQKSELHTFTGHTSPISCLELMNNSMTFLAGGEDGLIKAWSIAFRREEYTLNGHTDSINSLKLTSDNLRLVSGSSDCKVYIWDLEKRIIELSLGGYSSPVFCVNITDDGSLLLTSSNDNILKLWKMREPSLVKDQTFSQKPFISVYTPDNKFELTYLYGRLNEVVEIDSSSKKIELGITDIYDPYYQSLIPFYNLIDNIRGGQFNTLLPDMSTLVFSRFSYTTIHILAYLGYSKVINELLVDNASIKTDYFGKSPLYYAISKQEQESIDTILNFLVRQSESNDKSRIHTSFGAIANDLPMIIRNSSKDLHLLLKSCLIPIDTTFAKVNQELPIYKFNQNFLPIAQDFTQGKTEDNESIPVIMKYTPFTLPSKMGSKDCINFLESIIECSNTSIYNTHLVQYVLQIQWDNLQMWVLGYTFMLWLNLILLVVLFTIDKIGETWVLPIFLLSNFLLITWEIIQLSMGGLIEYLKDAWNLIDFFRFTLTMIWVVWNLSNYDKNLEYRILAWIVALLNFTRGLTGFRVFDGTRYYVRLILRALGDMGYFFIMLGYSTITFGVMFQLSRTNTVFDFKTLWMDSYSLNFGNFEAQEQYQFSFETLAYMLATIVNVILMLNLLISILGDSYSNFQTDKVFIDYSEKASVILEIQKMFFWVGIEKEYKYFHVMCSSAAADEDETIDERINGIETSLNNLHEVVKKNCEANREQFGEKLMLHENKINDKIGQLEINFQKKLDEVNDNIKQILLFVQPKVEEKKVEEVKAV